jgi:ribosomal protein S18 acetylase RimI-like enzyme
MRGVISPKLSDFITQVNVAAEEAKASGILFSPSLVRGNLDKLEVFIGQGPELAYVKGTFFDTPTHVIPVRVYSPAPDEPLPVVLHYHGGGHMCGNIELYDAISRKIAKAGHCIVIAVEYRLAPEFPYPAGIEDSQYVLEHYQQVLTEVEYNQQLMIAGDSAGGAICTTLASNNITSDKVKIDKQILVYPSVDYTLHECAAIYAGGVFGEISELYVKPECRSLKVGELLLTTVIEFGKTREWKRLEVGSPSSDDSPRTFNFYEKQGFQCTGARLRFLI